MFKAAPWWSLAYCVVYLAIVALIATAASSKGMCGDGDFRPSCGMFAFGVALYGALAIGAISTITVLVGIVVRRRVSLLLKSSAILYVSALLSLVLPVWAAAGSKLAGAIVVMAVLPVSLVLLSAALICIVLWAGRAWARGSSDAIVGVPQASSNN